MDARPANGGFWAGVSSVITGPQLTRPIPAYSGAHGSDGGARGVRHELRQDHERTAAVDQIVGRHRTSHLNLE